MFNQNSRDIYSMNVRNGGSFGKVATIPADLDVSPRTLPTATRASDPGGRRFRADATVLADGTVFLSGGARASQKLDKAVHFGEIRDPETDTWTQMRESIDRKARLYHSTAILLPDASVLLSADGPPGPVVIHTADIFYPPYLFNADGTDATRPEILDIGELNHQSRFTMSPGNSAAISKVALVRAGSVTHSLIWGSDTWNSDLTRTGQCWMWKRHADATVHLPDFIWFSCSIRMACHRLQRRVC